ncbi:MAG: putative O-glycosylation ligase, exosortase A system-associated [Pseudomonadota bacterium]
MRDALLLLFLLTALAIALRYPFVGLLTWAWFTLMTPHQLAYGVYGVPLNLVIAAATIASFLAHNGFKAARLDATSAWMALFSLWLVISQQFSLDPENSAEFADRFVKTMVFALLCAQVATDRLRLNALIWIMTLSLGYFAAKGALFTLVTLGRYRVQGIEETILEDNNHMGIALATTLPLILYLRDQAARASVRFGLVILFVLTIIAIIGTHSRGAFVSLIAFAGFFWLKSKRKGAILGALALVLIPTVAFMPPKWIERMSSIGEAAEDASFMGRVDAWVINAKLAADNPVTGAGLRNSYEPEIAATVDKDRATTAKAAHSIYFEVLGGAGMVGLALYLGAIASAFVTTLGLQHAARQQRAPPWIGQSAYYLQIALAVFCVGGASVSLEMWDGYWLIVAMIAAMSRMATDDQHARGRALGDPHRRRWRIASRGRAPV